jgi:hypothetical protein
MLSPRSDSPILSAYGKRSEADSGEDQTDSAAHGADDVPGLPTAGVVIPDVLCRLDGRRDATGTPDLDEVARRLTRAGHAVEGDANFPGYRRCYVSDPFGNRLESSSGSPDR